MRFRNGLRLLMENFKQVYKLLLAKLIIGLVALVLCCAFVLPELLHVWNSAAVQGLLENLKTFFITIFLGDPAKMQGIKDAIFGEGGSLSQVTSLLSTMTLEIVLTVIGCVVVYLLRRFADTLCHFTTGSMLNDKMTTYAETKFSSALVANLGKASAYSAIYVPTVFLFDVAMLALLWLILTFLPVIPSLFLAITAMAVLQALKLMLTGTWLPAMTADNMRIFHAMRSLDKSEKKQLSKSFSNYLISVYLIIVVNVLMVICTFGSALIITVPASYFFLICMQYVDYYTVKGKKYFLTYEQIATNLDHGDSEHYFDYIGEESVEENKENENKENENNN